MSALTKLATRPQRTALVVAVLALITLMAAGIFWAAPAPATAAGGSITSPDTFGYVGKGTSLALDASGNPVVSYNDHRKHDLKLVHCNDPNCSGGDESITSPDTSGDVGRSASLALDALGNPVVSYMDLTNFDLKLLHCNDPNCGGGDESITSPDAVNNAGMSTSLALDASGNPVVSYYDITNHDLMVLHCNDPNCAGGDESITAPDSIGGVGAFSSLALDASGNPVVGYYDGTNGDLKILHCNDPNCAGGDESITSPDTVGLVGAYTSLALDASGNPVVTYHEIENSILKVLHCNDPNCSGGDESITSPDTVNNAGMSTSLALDAYGNPVVSYMGLANDDLKLIHCDDPNCAPGGESITSPDTSGSVGAYTSLALDGSGNPVVSYYNNTNSDLNLLHCGDPNCTDVKPTPTPTPASPPFFSIGVDLDGDATDECNTGGPTVECSVPLGTEFMLRYYLDALPYDLDGYLGFDLFITFQGVLPAGYDLAAVDPWADVWNNLGTAMGWWPQCEFAAAASLEDSKSVVLGCALGLEFESSDYTGQIAAWDFQCSDSGTLTMVHDDGVGGFARTSLLGLDGEPHAEGAGTTETLTINCLESLPPTPTVPPVGGAGVFPGASGADASGGPGGIVAIALAAAAAGAAVLAGSARYARRRQAQ